MTEEEEDDKEFMTSGDLAEELLEQNKRLLLFINLLAAEIQTLRVNAPLLMVRH